MKSVCGWVLGSLFLVGAIGLRPAAAQPGAPSPASVKDKDIVKAAQFAVKAQQQAMKKDHPKAKLTLVKIVSAQKQVVAGMNYILTLQVKVGDKLRTAEAKVWERAWLKKIELTSWKFTDDGGEDAKPADDRDADSPQPAGKAGKPLKFTTYDRPYFVKNTFEPNAAESFAVIKSLAEFDGIFGVGMVMGGQRPQIKDATFQSQIVVAVVKRGPMSRYTVESVAAKGNGLEVQYKVKTDPPGSATFAVPLIVAVPKGDYASVTFVENGKGVKVVK